MNQYKPEMILGVEGRHPEPVEGRAQRPAHMLRRATHDMFKENVFVADQLRVKTGRTMPGMRDRKVHSK